MTIGLPFDPTHSPIPSQIEFEAIWDTGASNSVISLRVAKKCGIKPTGVTEVHTAAGKRECNKYLVSLSLPNHVGFPALSVTEAPLHSFDVLIGMDIIARGDFVVTNFQRKTVLSFRTPSVGKIDFVEEIKETNKSKKGRVSRNAPCPCGSGKKYKKCHGA